MESLLEEVTPEPDLDICMCVEQAFILLSVISVQYFMHHFLDVPLCHCQLSFIVKRAMEWGQLEEEARSL